MALGDEPVLRDVGLTILRGERVGVIGANGAGKSVLVKLLTGQLEPADGRALDRALHQLGRLAQEHDSAAARARRWMRSGCNAPAPRARRCSC